MAELSGVVRISVVGQDGKEIALIATARERLWRNRLQDGGTRTPTDALYEVADASCSTDVTVLIFRREEQSAAIMALEVGVVSGRLRCSSDQVEDLSFGEWSVRMAIVLLRFENSRAPLAQP